MKPSDVKIGQKVTYYSVLRKDGTKFIPFLTEIVDIFKDENGKITKCFLAGKSGVFSIDNLEVYDN